MNTEQQRIAIAEACGWRFDPMGQAHKKLEAIACWVRPGNCDWQTEVLPDYLNSLDAMHEAEKMLTEKQRDGSDGYMEWLDWVVVRDGSRGRSWHTAHATAAQRAEAFLRTIGKWEASK